MKKPIPDPGVKKAPVFGFGTLLTVEVNNTEVKLNSP
jgi:hypothetical protein